MAGGEEGKEHVKLMQLAGVEALLSSGGKVRIIVVFNSCNVQL